MPAIVGTAAILGISIDARAAVGDGSETPDASSQPVAAQPLTTGVALRGADSLGEAQSIRDNELILEVYLRHRQQLSDGIIAYYWQGDIFVPLEEVALLLEFAIKETKTGASGWFLSEDRTFKLIRASNEVVSAGKRYTLAPGDVREIDGQLYVSARGLASWFGIAIHADLNAMRMRLNPVELVPLERRKKREKQKYGSITQFRSVLPRYYAPYAFMQIPAIEADLAIGYSDSSNTSFFSAGTVRAYGDLAWMNAELFVTGTNDEIRDARLTLGRRDPDGGLLYGLNATEWQVGDVTAPGVSLVASSLSGRGMRISSRPLASVALFDRITLEGALPVNWTIEVYRNNIILNSFGPSTTGRYRFDGVPLLRGNNEIRLEFYGPQGQRRTETENYNVGGSQVPVGQLQYDVAIQEVGRSLFGFSNILRDELRRRDEFDDSSFGGAALIDYGLTRSLSVTAGVVMQPLPKKVREASGVDERFYGTAGIRTRVAGFAVSLDGAIDDEGGTAAGLAAQTSYEGWNVAFRHEQFLNGFVSQATYIATASRLGLLKTSQSTARVDTFYSNLVPGVHVNMGASGSLTTYDDLPDIWSAGLFMNATAGRFSIGNDIFYGNSLYGRSSGLFGSARVNWRVWNSLNLRASASYDMRDDVELDAYSVGLTAPLAWDWTFGLGYQRTFDTSDDRLSSEAFFTSLRKKFDFASLGLVVGYDRHEADDSDDGFRAALTLSFNTFTDPSTLETFVSSDRIARRGALRARTYEDYNRNGIRDPGEPYIEDARIKFAAQKDPYHSGSGLSEPIGTGAWTDVVVDPAGLPDASLSPGNRGRSILARPGVVTEIELPVIATAGLEGRLRLDLGDRKRDLQNMTVQVVRIDEQGGEKVVASTSTEFDGVFAFAEVPVGRYLVRVDPAQAKQIGARLTAPREVELNSQTGVLTKVNIELQQE